MVNKSVITGVPLGGRGFVKRQQGKFQPGEYKRLTNMEITPEGALVSRAPVLGYDGAADNSNLVGGVNDVTHPPILNPDGFLGHVGPYVIFNGSDQVYAVNSTIGQIRKLSWARSARFEHTVGGGAAFSTDGSSLYEKPVAVHLYNGKIYWVSFALNNTVTTVGFNRTWEIRVRTQTYDGTDPITSLNSAFSAAVVVAKDACKSDIVTSQLKSSDAPDIVKTFVHKNRLWIVTERAVYFSKASDPTVWTVPSGGFIKYDESLDDAVAQADTIFLVGPSNISTINYSIDPNDINDLTLNVVSSNMGARSIAIHDSVPYVVRNDALYSVSASGVAKVMDLNLGLIESSQGSVAIANASSKSSTIKVILTSYRRYLIISNIQLARIVTDTDSNAGTAKTYPRGYAIQHDNNPEVATFADSGHAVDAGGIVAASWMLNMDLGTISTFRYSDLSTHNYLYNPTTGDGSSAGWQIYGLNTLITVTASNPAETAAEGPYNYFLISKTLAGSNMGMRTTPPSSGLAGMVPRPAGQQVTLYAEVRNPVGSLLTAIQFIARDDTNNDSAVLGSITDGAISQNVPPDGIWRGIWVTGTIAAARNLEAIYVAKNTNNADLNEKLHVRNIKVVDGTIANITTNAQTQYQGSLESFFVYPKFDAAGGAGDVLFLNTNNARSVGRAAGRPSKGFIYFLDPSSNNSLDSDKPFYDIKRSLAGTYGVYTPLVEITIPGYTPDGTEYFFKKFRSLALEGALPWTSNYSLKVVYNQRSSSTQYPASMIQAYDFSNDAKFQNNPQPARFGILQRARSLDILLNATSTFVSNGPYWLTGTDVADPQITNAFKFRLNIVSMILFWSPTSRAMEYSTKLN